MAKKETKTNAMRILERMKIPFTHQEYECDEFTDGSDVAEKLGLPHERVFKTLVTEGNDRQHYVFVIPVDEELDLKASCQIRMRSGAMARQSVLCFFCPLLPDLSVTLNFDREKPDVVRRGRKTDFRCIL